MVFSFPISCVGYMHQEVNSEILDEKFSTLVHICNHLSKGIMLEVADFDTGTFIEVKNRSESYDRSEIEILQFPCEDNAYDAQKCDQNDRSEIEVLEFPRKGNVYDTERFDENKEKICLPYVIATSQPSSPNKSWKLKSKTTKKSLRSLSNPNPSRKPTRRMYAPKENVRQKLKGTSTRIHSGISSSIARSRVSSGDVSSLRPSSSSDTVLISNARP